MESCVADEGIPNIIGLFRHLAAGHVAPDRGGSSWDNNTEHYRPRGRGGFKRKYKAEIFIILLLFGLLTSRAAAGKICRGVCKAFMKSLLPLGKIRYH